MLGVIGALVAALLGAVDVTRSIAAAHVARSAADLAALAGAGVAVRGGAPAAACSAASRLATANHAVLATCSIAADGSVRVTVTVNSRGRWARTAHAAARAGPG